MAISAATVILARVLARTSCGLISRTRESARRTCARSWHQWSLINRTLAPILEEPVGNLRRPVILSMLIAPARRDFMCVHPGKQLLISKLAPSCISIVTPGLAIVMGLTGCVLAPQGTMEEHAKLDETAPHFEPPVETRDLPVLPAPASWRDVLHRAFLANGELESAYFEWKAALARIDQVATWPNTNVAVNFSYMFSRENMKFWDRTTIGAGFDPSMNLSLPIKVQTAGEVALEAARQAAERFRAVKFDLQRKILSAYLDLVLTEEKIRIERDNLKLLGLVRDSAAFRVQSGGPQQDLLKAETDFELATNKIRNLESEANSLRAMLNGMLARDAKAPLKLAPSLPSPRAVAADDAQLIAVAVDQNPELAGLARQVAGRRDAIELARLAYLPDIIPAASITGNIAQVIATMVMLPTKIPAIRAAISDAEAMSRSADAMLRQTEKDRAASFVANLYLMRNAERQTTFYRRRIVPIVEQLLTSSRQAYAAGTVGFADLIDSDRTYISVRAMVAEARIEREKRLAELEALAGVDIETLGRPTTVWATLPTK
jgi:cobalt-zinc-cadmium efflux system outer membrane protein